MMYVKSWSHYFIRFLIVLVMMGCAEPDIIVLNNADICYCRTLEEQSMAQISASCETLLAELEGVWDGLGERENTRFEIKKDGYYAFWVMKNDKWYRQYDGHFWIDFDIVDGMFQTIIHIPVPDNENYSVLYHILDNVIYFEEPSDFEPNMRYGKVEM